MGIVIRVLVIVLAVVVGLFVANNWDNWQQHDRNGSGATRALQVAFAQSPVQRQVPAFPEPLGRMGGLRPHECPYEDGDPLARTLGHTVSCLWTNPRTGRTYFVDSAEYLH